MSKERSVGLIGLDTSHVQRFTELLNDAEQAHHVPGGRVTVGFSGGVPGFARSADRVEKFTSLVRDQYGVEIVDSPEAVAERADLVMITAVDGRTHLEMLKRVISAGKPVYIDKPLACSFKEAYEIFQLAQQHDVPLMSTSALRYSQPLVEELQGQAGDSAEDIRGVDVFGPLEIEPQQPGWYWYGIHMLEVAVTLLGPGAKTVQVIAGESQEVAVVVYEDGRVASLRGWTLGARKFGATLHRDSGSKTLHLSSGDKPYYAGLLEAIMASLPVGRSAVPARDTLEVIRLIEAINQSRENGKMVEVATIGDLP